MDSLNERLTKKPWMVSLHGGHSADYCDHASGGLREMLDAAISAGYHTFGVSEHAPRCEERFLYPNEHVLGWTVEKTIHDFERYIADISTIAEEYKGRLNVVRGFECEVVPERSYIERTQSYLARRIGPDYTEPVFDFFVGSVHYVDEIPVDDSPERWRAAANEQGGPQQLIVAYYRAVEQLVIALEPDVVGHFDLIRLNLERAGFDPQLLATKQSAAAVESALEIIRQSGGILDLNTAGWRKGLNDPYPEPWIVSRAHSMGISFCFGDDSHRHEQVGYGIDRAREYLLANGVRTIQEIASGGIRSTRLLA